ncbi:TetR/AcrR family transcriptional regulator [Actinomadura opuntiae]|uniref:TetR/AcrR family transcriptional regulator n=1 Tax=Actinomadura sp. OS1-43 TaxID=604315 RepID=UPI00255A8EB3|nr:helix-turn-helix domain-containing protein [Actinomadura sp. OS1-43]MDL4819315.1 helix-turn-helix domain-containing protein [Actinomadura sp. OS1-43]
MSTGVDPQELPPGLALAWGLPIKTSKLGRPPSQSVEQVVEAAIDLADADGFAALSMPKLAKKLGLTANAIYRYVRSRDELLVLVAETGWGPAPDLVSGADRWRTAATTWTQAMIDRCGVHPWLVDLPVRGAPMTPNLLRWTEVILETLTGAGLSPKEAIQCALLLDVYARRIAGIRRDLRQSSAGSVKSTAVQDFLLPLLREHGYPIVAALMLGGDYSDDIDDSDVTFGLTRILDGIDGLLPGSGNHHTADPAG